MVGQSADIVVALDNRRVAHAALDNIGIYCALNEEIHPAEPLALVFKNADKLLADNFSLLLRLGHACELGEETLLGVDSDELHIKALAEDVLDLVALVLSEQTVVNENAGQLLADRSVQEHGCNGAVDSAGHGAEHGLVAYLLAQVLYLLFDEA